MNSSLAFKWRHFQQDVILLNVRWYLKYQIIARSTHKRKVARFRDFKKVNALATIVNL